MKKIAILVSLLTLVVLAFGVVAQQKPAMPEKPAMPGMPGMPAVPATPAPPTVPGKPEMEKMMMQRFSGTIARVDEMGKMIDVKGRIKKEEKTMTFAIDDKAKITKGKEEMKMADLKEGTRVSVEYKKEGDKMIATAIKLSVPKAAKEKAAPK